MPVSRPHPALRLEQDGALLAITLDNPERRNAQTPSLWLALADVARRLDRSVRVVIIRGEGPSFSAGLDRALLSADTLAGITPASIARFQEGFASWAQLPVVTIAAVQGHAIGAGFQLALAADLRVVADDVAFAMRETSLGLVPDLGGTAPLVQLMGYARALEICATGRFVGAQEAVSTGLASRAVPAAELDATARGVADAILQAPEAAVRELKLLLRSATGATPADQLRAEREAQARLLTAMAVGKGK